VQEKKQQIKYVQGQCHFVITAGDLDVYEDIFRCWVNGDIFSEEKTAGKFLRIIPDGRAGGDTTHQEEEIFIFRIQTEERKSKGFERRRISNPLAMIEETSISGEF